MSRHFGCGTREYQAWCRMRQSCYDKKYPGYKTIGGRGISAESSWEDFKVFIKDMGPIPKDCNSLLRKDVDLGYSKMNCEWGYAPRGRPKKNPDLAKKYPKKRYGQFDKPKQISIVLENEHYEWIKRQAIHRSVQQGEIICANDVIREALQKAFPAPKQFDMFGSKH